MMLADLNPAMTMMGVTQHGYTNNAVHPSVASHVLDKTVREQS